MRVLPFGSGRRLLAGFFLFSLFVFLVLPFQFLEAAVTNNGTAIYGDTTNAGTVKLRLFTNPGTYGGEISGPTTGNTSNLIHIVGKVAPTRDEAMVGVLKVDGRLDIFTCTGSTGCDASGEFTARWNNPGTTGTQDCDSAPTLGTCTQAFDIGYESLSGRAMVVYGDNVADRVYYALWDGSAWSPNASPGSPGASNQIDLPGTAGTPRWIRVVPAGDTYASERVNRVMVLIADSNDDLFAYYWDGSSFDGGTTLLSTLGLCDRGRCFDGNWQFTTNFVTTYTNSGQNEVRYQKYTVGSGWGGDTQAYTTAATPTWIIQAADPTSSRIINVNFTTGNDTRGAVWRADDSTDGWTVCAAGGCPDTGAEGLSGPQAWVSYERYNGEAYHVFMDAGTTAASADYMTVTSGSTWSNSTTLGFTGTDDGMNIKSVAAPNSDDIMVFISDVDCDADMRMWNGSALQTISSDFDLLISSTNNTCANSGPIVGMGIGHAWDFIWRSYSPWARNWQWFSGADTGAQPTTSLANENVTPTGFDSSAGTARLRYSMIELTSNAAQTDARKKLQYTTDSPDSLTATWADVDDVGGAGIWRYRDCNGGSSVCDDNTVITGSAVLTGSPTLGWWTQDKDAAAGTNMDHSAGQLRELEFSIEANGASPSTTYYFRMFDLDQLTPVFREQDNDGSNDCATAACTYPSITTQAVTIATVTTGFAANVSPTGATLNGAKIAGDNGTQHGFAHSTDSTFTTGVSTSSLGTITSNTAFSNVVGSLTPDQTYFFRAYVTNGGGTAYGVTHSFYTGNSTATRKMRLFEGYRIKLLDGKLNLR